MGNGKEPVIVSHIRALVSSIGRVLSKHVDNETIELVDDKLTLKKGSVDASKLAMSDVYTAVYDALGIPAPSSDAFVLFGGGFDSYTTEHAGSDDYQMYFPYAVELDDDTALFFGYTRVDHSAGKFMLDVVYVDSSGTHQVETLESSATKITFAGGLSINISSIDYLQKMNTEAYVHDGSVYVVSPLGIARMTESSTNSGYNDFFVVWKIDMETLSYSYNFINIPYTQGDNSSLPGADSKSYQSNNYQFRAPYKGMDRGYDFHASEVVANIGGWYNQYLEEFNGYAKIDLETLTAVAKKPTELGLASDNYGFKYVYPSVGVVSLPDGSRSYIQGFYNESSYFHSLGITYDYETDSLFLSKYKSYDSSYYSSTSWFSEAYASWNNYENYGAGFLDGHSLYLTGYKELTKKTGVSGSVVSETVSHKAYEFTGELSSSDIEATPTFCARRGNTIVARISASAFWVIDLASKLNWAFVGSLPDWKIGNPDWNGPMPIHMFKSGVMAHVSQGDYLSDNYTETITVQTVVPKNYGKVTI